MYEIKCKSEYKLPLILLNFTHIFIFNYAYFVTILNISIYIFRFFHTLKKILHDIHLYRTTLVSLIQTHT